MCVNKPVTGYARKLAEKHKTRQESCGISESHNWFLEAFWWRLSILFVIKGHWGTTVPLTFQSITCAFTLAPVTFVPLEICLPAVEYQDWYVDPSDPDVSRHHVRWHVLLDILAAKLVARNAANYRFHSRFPTMSRFSNANLLLKLFSINPAPWINAHVDLEGIAGSCVSRKPSLTSVEITAKRSQTTSWKMQSHVLSNLLRLVYRAMHNEISNAARIIVSCLLISEIHGEGTMFCEIVY